MMMKMMMVVWGGVGRLVMMRGEINETTRWKTTTLMKMTSSAEMICRM